MALVLPSIEAARAELGELVTRPGWPFGSRVDLFQVAPVTVAPLAGVLVVGRALRRETWLEPVEISEALFERLSKGAPIEPPVGQDERDQSQLDAASAKRADCTHCGVRPGLGPCPRCTGTGLIARNDQNAPVWLDCPDCDRGFVTCTVCEGTRRMIAAQLRHVHDHPVVLRRLVLPELPEWLDEAVRDLFASAGEPAAELAHDPEPTFSAAAYRGAMAASAAAFHGHTLGKANQEAYDLRAAFAYAKDTTNAAVRCYAQPFVIGRWHVRGMDRTAVFLVSEGSQHACVVEDTYGKRG